VTPGGRPTLGCSLPAYWSLGGTWQEKSIHQIRAVERVSLFPNAARIPITHSYHVHATQARLATHAPQHPAGVGAPPAKVVLYSPLSMASEKATYSVSCDTEQLGSTETREAQEHIVGARLTSAVLHQSFRHTKGCSKQDESADNLAHLRAVMVVVARAWES
jgi:hypothetical protein